MGSVVSSIPLDDLNAATRSFLRLGFTTARKSVARNHIGARHRSKLRFNAIEDVEHIATRRNMLASRQLVCSTRGSGVFFASPGNDSRNAKIVADLHHRKRLPTPDPQLIAASASFTLMMCRHEIEDHQLFRATSTPRVLAGGNPRSWWLDSAATTRDTRYGGSRRS